MNRTYSAKACLSCSLAPFLIGLPLNAIVQAVDLVDDFSGRLVEVNQSDSPTIRPRAVGMFVGPVVVLPAERFGGLLYLG